MDWLRRNWPDLLIGIALVAVIAGIVATLMGGGSFLPFGQQGPVETTRQLTSPSAPQPTPPAQVPAEPEEAADTIIPVVPTNGQLPVETEAEAPQIAPAPPSETEPSPITPAPPQPEATEPQPATPAPQAAPAGATASLQEPSYRVGVGAFANEENANRRAQQFRNEGYPVFIGRQAELFLVLVGPYADASEANAVAARIREAGLESEPRIFSYTPDDQDAAPAPTPAAAQPTTQAPPAAETPPAEGRRYLQVGAYNSLQSAQPQRERMQEMGFEVTVRELERDTGTLYRLLVGPFAPNELATAQERLNALGIENFATD